MRDLNKDWKLRNKIIGETGRDTFHHFNINYDTLKKLICHNFADLEQTQNNSPTIKRLLEVGENLGEDYRFGISYEGYAVNSGREDYRVSIEGFAIYDLDSERAGYLLQEFRSADELEYNKNIKIFRAWWD